MLCNNRWQFDLDIHVLQCIRERQIQLHFPIGQLLADFQRSMTYRLLWKIITNQTSRNLSLRNEKKASKHL